ncbi:MAG: phytoene desaturase [Proteobacteria bacterium]|nr:phytoene desaturase [Pseudomonadota bacterium]
MIVVIGAGIGGLACAIDLASQGMAVTVIEKAEKAGGKMREADIAGRRIDSGPTVFTMRWVFEDLFARAGASFEDYVSLSPLATLARHAWSENERFDLFADVKRAAEAVSEFSSPAEAKRFLAFCDEARTIYRTLKEPFLSSPRPNPISLTARIGLDRPAALFGIRPFETMWRALSKHFHDPRLRQLFGRYATYNGSSPFLAPATLMLIAHVEQDGVWTVDGGMQRLAEALEKLAREKGVAFRFGEDVQRIFAANNRVSGVVLASGERIEADSVVVNADAAALEDGLFGKDVAHATKAIRAKDRALSAITWAAVAKTQGFPLLHHNVFFSNDYAAEFEDIFKRARLPVAPTVYVCAQDRSDGAVQPDKDRLFLLVNAPAIGDHKQFSSEDIASCRTRMFERLQRCGLTVTPDAIAATTPTDFHRMFPATGGALYGRASHGWMASFQRPGSATRIAGLYLAGGSTHPGAGVPMAALSGHLAATRLVSDRASMRRFRRAAISGGISTASAATGVTRSR